MLSEGELKSTILLFLNEEDGENWGWGLTALNLLKDKIDEARRKFPRVERCDDPEFGRAVRDRRRTEWAREWLGVE